MRGNSEVLCLDEGFCQHAHSILWRVPEGRFSLEKYFRSIPIADVLIHVDAPTDIRVRRQRKRGRLILRTSKDPYESAENDAHICNEIKECVENYTNVISVVNTGEIDDVVNDVVSELKFFK